jgi:hypothetical protein
VDQRIASTITDLLERVPGYTGYRSLEDRRDDDRRLRETIANAIDRIVQKLTDVSATLAEQRNLAAISTIERLVGSTRLLGDRVRTASYGYGGIFTDRSVDEVALEQLRQFDISFEQEVGKLGDLATRIASSPDGPLDADITAYQDELNRVAHLFDERSTVVDQGRPSKDVAVLKMLEPTVAPRPSPLSGLTVGDAFSVDGDNFIAEATIEFSDASGTLTLTKAGTGDDGNEIWFLGGSDEARGTVRLAPADSPAEVPSGGTVAKATVTANGEAASSVPAEYGYTGGTGTATSFWYAIGGEPRTFTGTSLEGSDIQVYGHA